MMRASELKQALELRINSDKRRALFVWGPPGVGKSSIVRQIGSENNLEVRDVRASLLDPVDLRGLPKLNGDNRAHWCVPDFLPRDGDGILFLDELANAPPLVQSACLQLALDRRIGEYTLPEGWRVIAASNRQEDRAGAHRLISSLSNRFLHLDLEVSNEDWQAWALTSGISPEVRSFLKFRPALLFAFDPSSGARSFPTPRSWEFVSEVVSDGTQESLLMPLVSGCIGEGPAAEYIAFQKVYRELPDPKEVLADPEGAKVPREPAIAFALVGALTEACRNASDKILTACVKYAARMQDEYAVLLIRDVTSLQPRTLTLPAASDWLKKHRDLLIGN